MQTPEEIAAAREAALNNLQFQKEALAAQHAQQIALSKRNSYQNFIQIAHSSLLESKRTLPVDQRAITAQEIIDFANQLKDAAETALAADD